MDPALRAHREAVVRLHMESENVHDFEATLATFSHPRYELIATGVVHDGPEEVRRYFRESRALFPDQRNELIALHHTDAGVVVEFWLLGTLAGSAPAGAPSGKSFRCRMAVIFLFEDRDLVCERVYFDSATIRAQITG